jgi:L-alanine-DL-glutamate epimerase-like enolase superfamily enzyme
LNLEQLAASTTVTKIDRVEACTVVVPLRAPVSFAGRTVRERHYTLVRVATEATEGLGFCYAGNVGGRVVTEAVRDLMAPVVAGQDVYRVKGIWEDLYQHLLLHGRAGSVMRALSAVDIAIWDLNARLVHLPLWKYLGAVATDVVAAYASGGYYLDGKFAHDLAEEVKSYVDLGFQAVKIKVGRATPAEDEQRVAAVRTAVGPDILVMLDANNAWRDLPTALETLRRLEHYNPYWIEEPFAPDDIDNHARLARATPIPVATGEIEAGRWQHKRLLASGAASVLQTDAAVCGGITEFQRIAALADGFGVIMAPHWFHDLHVHLVATTPNARFVEFFPDDKVLNFRRLIDTQLAIAGGGMLKLPTAPGLGFEFLASAVAEFQCDGWR